MIILIKLYSLSLTMNMILLMTSNLLTNFYFYLYMLLSFLIKLPIFLHLWLPKAHVEAPVTGSMILASIMLMLGSYGILRMMFIIEHLCTIYNYLLISFSMLGSLITSLICLKQIDMKKLVAYSSIVHMCMLLSSILTMTYLGITGSMIMMVGHGLCSSALFFLINISYTRLKSRSLLLNKGTMNISLSLTFFWFFLCIFNMSSPPSLNLFSEMFLINSILKYSLNLIFNTMILCMFSVMYSMFIYSLTQHGNINKNMNNFFSINFLEFLTLSLHLTPLFILILNFY